MKFICLGYADHAKFRSMSEAETQKVMDECFDYDDVLRAGGHFVGGEALQSGDTSITLRYRDEQVQATDGPYAETKEQLGGILILEADNREHAVELMSKHPGIRVGPFEIRPADEHVNAMVEARDQQFKQKQQAKIDEQQILELMAKWRAALERKDVAAMMEDYAEDALLFDGIPPYKTEGVDGIRQVWENCLPYFPDEFKSEHRDIQIHVSGDTAIAHGLHHFVPTPADHPCGQTWLRVTIGFRRIAGQWKVVHEHASIPFNPMTNQAWQITDPDKLDMPDYTAAP